jgi:hypothetical protein
METKPFSIQSPEAIAKEYGGNKQKIAQAMQMGIVDPTAGTLAGMFIDRMRSAAQQEQAPQQTVAQQIMAPQPTPAPPAPPAGLGATPEAAQMMAPPMEQAQAMAPPMEQATGMAGGGMVPPYMAGGGLTDLPVPDGMFDEPHNGSYAGGGIVAFAAGTPRGVKATKAKTPEELAAEAKAKSPKSLYGNYENPEAQREYIESIYKPEREASTSLMDRLKGAGSPEEMQRRKNEDIGSFLMDFGANWASTPGDFFSSAGESLKAAAPGLRESAKERRADQMDALKTMAAQEGLNNKEALDLYKLVQEGTNKYGEFDVARLTREQQERLAFLQEKGANFRARMQADASMYGSDMQYKGQVEAAGLGLDRENARITQLAAASVDKKLSPGGEYAVQYNRATNKPAFRQQMIAEEVAMLGGNISGGGDAGVIRYGADGKRI